MSDLRWAIVIAILALLLAGCQGPAVSPAQESVPGTADEVPRITPNELKRFLDAGQDVIVVDARSRASYDHLHIPGALSIPLDEIEARYDELPKGKKIVLYCT